METIEKEKKSLIGDKNLDRLKKILPKRYYKEFEQEFIAKWSKKEPIPSRQIVYLTLQGKSSDYMILEVLNVMASKRIDLAKRINETCDARQ